MSDFCKRFADRVAVTVCLLAALGCPGCGRLGAGALRALLTWPADPPEQAENSPEQAQPEADAPAAVSSDERVVLSGGGWVQAIHLEKDGRPAWRWRRPELEEILALPAEQRPDFRRYLADRDPTVAANAAICLARLGDAAGAEQLVLAARSRAIKMPMRCAAIEALAALQEPSAGRLLGELLDQYGPQASASSYHAELHAELIHGLARHVDPADDARFVEALRSPAATVRLEALRAWASGRNGTLPVEAVDLRTEGDPRVRAAALQALARRTHPQAHRHLAAALHDHDLRVRTAAVAALGELGGHEAQTTLKRLLDGQPEKIRSAAVAAVAQLSDKDAVLGALSDDAWRVRLEVARALARYADREGAAAARELLDDPSPQVQREVVSAVAEWPLERAGPILLAAMDKAGFTTRKTAAEQLAARWPPAGEFPVEGPAERRAGVLENLRQRFLQQFSPVDRAALARPNRSHRTAPTLAPEQLARVEQLVRDRDVRALLDFGPALVEALEQLVCDEHGVLPEVIYREVLPQCSPAFVPLSQLTSPDAWERRRAAGELAELAGRRPLSRLATSRLVDLVSAESDQLVWQTALAAVSADASEPSIRLAYAGASHPSPEVRRRACEHLAAHPHPRHAEILLPALEDRSHSVVCAAVRALGAAGRMDDTGPLRRLLGTTNERLRLETATALVRLGDRAGTAALRRLAHSPDPTIRRGVAAEMGRLADASFVPPLIRLLDDRPSVSRAALESLPQVVGHDPSQNRDQTPVATIERIRRWKEWFERRGGVPESGP